MPLSDYIPNIIGAPIGYEGLLGADPTKKLETQANLQGLLGVAASLAQGMSSQGPRRSALQNILGSLAGGFGATQQAYQQGLQQFGQQQDISQRKIAAEQAANLRASVEQVMQMPEVANNPALVAALRADPINTLKLINENQAAAATYGPVSTGQPAQTSQYAQYVQPSPVDQAKLLSGEVSQIDRQASLPTTLVQDERSRLDQRLEELSRSDQAALRMAEGKKIIDKNEAARKDILRQKAQLSVITSSKDLAELEDSFVPLLRPALTQLRAQMADGLLTPVEAQKATADLQKINFEYQVKNKDFTNESIRVAKTLFPTKSIDELEGPELGKVQARLQAEAKARGKSSAPIINVGERSFATSFGKGVAESVEGTFAAAQGAQSTLSTIQSIKPIIKAGVYSGPLSTVPRVINQLATSLGVTGANDNEILKNTAVAMQGLASLEMSAAQAMKGQGAITENERGLIKRASAGDLQTFTQPEVLSLLNALEKTSKFKIKAHEKNLQRLKARPDTAELADFYSLEPMAPEVPVGSAASLQEAARKEQERRKGGQ